jgi:L-lysine 6-transaminase
MVRSQRVLEIIESEGLIEQAGPKGAQLVAGLEKLRNESGLISNVRGRGSSSHSTSTTVRSATLFLPICT